MVKDWKEYEWGVIMILYDEMGKFTLRHNVKITGRSSQTRQIDLLVFKDIWDKNSVGEIYDINHCEFDIFDCKKRDRPVNIKEVEQFIGLVSDTNARHGIIISSCGFTSGAKQRAKIEKNVRLRKISWEQAYNAASKNESTNQISTYCGNCRNPNKDSKLYGKILWYGWYPKIFEDETIAFYWIGKCLKCEIPQLHCEACGMTFCIEGDKMKCPDCGYDYIPYTVAQGTGKYAC